MWFSSQVTGHRQILCTSQATATTNILIHVRAGNGTQCFLSNSEVWSAPLWFLWLDGDGNVCVEGLRCLANQVVAKVHQAICLVSCKYIYQHFMDSMQGQILCRLWKIVAKEHLSTHKKWYSTAKGFHLIHLLQCHTYKLKERLDLS